MNKKGFELPLIYLAELLILGFISYAVMHNVYGLVEKDAVLKEVIHEDFRMMIDTLAGLPGDAIVKYPHNLSQFSLIITDNNKITLFKDGDLNKLWKYFFLPENYTIQGSVEKKANVCLVKTNNNILLKECLEEMNIIEGEKDSSERDNEPDGEIIIREQVPDCNYLLERTLPLYINGGTDLRQFFCTESILQVSGLDYGYQSNPREIQQVVIHYTYGLGTGKNVVEDWARRDAQVSAHYIIDRSGNIDYAVDEQDIAFHAMNHNTKSIGIELVNLGPGCDSTFNGGDGSGNYHRYGFCRGVQTVPGSYPGKSNYDQSLQYQSFTVEQMESLITLALGLKKKYDIPLQFAADGITEGFTGHIHTEDVRLGLGQNRKVDPGPAFPWDYFGCRVKEESDCESTYSEDYQKLLPPAMIG